VGSRRNCTWILGLSGFRVMRIEGEEETHSRLQIHVERRGRCYPCGGCGRCTARVRSSKERTWDDLPWAAHPVTLMYQQRRVICRRCGIRTERVDFADAKARVTRRLRQQIGVDYQSMPTSHAAVRHGVSWGKARRTEKTFLAGWDERCPKRQPRHIGLDEIQRGKGQRFWTVLSDVVHGEVMGLRQDRSEGTATALLTEDLTARQRAAITAVCTDMHRPYLNAVGEVLKQAEVVFDKFRVLQHASWLLLRRWKTVRGSKRRELEALFAANRRSSKPTCCANNSTASGPPKPAEAGSIFSSAGFVRYVGSDCRRWSAGRLPLQAYRGIAAYCDHHVRFGVVESINTTIKAVLRRARGMKDEEMLLLKLKRATAHPIRSARDLARFLNVQPLYSNR